MAVALSITVQGLDELHERLDRMSPKKNPAWVGRAVRKSAELTQKITAEEMFILGSRFRGPKGPRGGKGKMRSAGTHPTKLTSRRGGAGIVGSIRTNLAPLPRAAEVGSDKVYAPVHELGLTVSRKTGTAKYPPRPFLGPGLEKAAKSFDRIFAKEWAKEMPA